MDDVKIRSVHLYDTHSHRNACGAPGQMNSTKYERHVTCTACLGVVRSARVEESAQLGGG